MENQTPVKAEGSGSPSIELKIVDQDGSVVRFKVKMRTMLGKVKKVYSERRGLPLGSLRFLYDGNRIVDDATPERLGMEHEDIVEVYGEQLGGTLEAKAN